MQVSVKSSDQSARQCGTAQLASERWTALIAKQQAKQTSISFHLFFLLLSRKLTIKWIKKVTERHREQKQHSDWTIHINLPSFLVESTSDDNRGDRYSVFFQSHVTAEFYTL